MAVKIQLTPQELLSQSQEMLNLQQEYETLFGQSQTLLNQVNDNWSANLANNFSGKLLSAQKSFRQIISMLETGGRLAAESAGSFESMDSLLAKHIAGKSGVLNAADAVQNGMNHMMEYWANQAVPMTGSRSLSQEEFLAMSEEERAAWLRRNVEGAVSSVTDTITGQLEHDMELLQSGLEKLEDLYHQLPEGIQDIWEFGVGQLAGTAAGIYDTVSNIINGNGWEAWESFVQTMPGLSQAYQLGEYIFCGGMMEHAHTAGHFLIEGLDWLLPDSWTDAFEDHYGINLVESWQEGWEEIENYWSEVGDYWSGKLDDFADGAQEFFGGVADFFGF